MSAIKSSQEVKNSQFVGRLDEYVISGSRFAILNFQSEGVSYIIRAWAGPLGSSECHRGTPSGFALGKLRKFNKNGRMGRCPQADAARFNPEIDTIIDTHF
jgi:hypothetical protein